MNIRGILKSFENQAPFCTTLKTIPLSLDAARSFFMRPLDEKMRYSGGFFGYAPLGHEHAGDCDDPTPVESFVIGENSCDAAEFPEELEEIRDSFFPACVRLADILFACLTNELELGHCDSFLRIDYQCALQINFFPAISTLKSSPVLRMGDHVDPGIFTLFPRGTDGHLEYLSRDGKWICLGEVSHPLVIAGKLMEFLSSNHIPALRHRVTRPKGENDWRFSLPFTVIPRRETKLMPFNKFSTVFGEVLTGKQFMENYLRDILMPDETIDF